MIQMNDVEDTSSNVCRRWQLGWPHYIQISRRHSSSAVITADNFIKMARISKGSRILDLGCGHGRITELLVEKVPSLEVVGVDMTRPLLESFIVKSGLNESKIELMCADITKLPLDDDGFDVVVSSRVFQYLPDPLSGVREALRVLKPGGHLVVSIPNKLNFIRYFAYDQKLYSPFEVRDWFRSCGLGNIEYGSMCFFPSSARWKRIALSLEVAAKIPLIKYLGGNVIVKGDKKRSLGEATARKPQFD
jgi:SAM-dependent methyltransferase